jgi:8-oxo-dGTP diphosphatase
MDFCFRCIYWVGFRLARIVWFVTRPRHRGALLALWHDGRILLLRTSYRPQWCLPGGGVERGESALEAVVREAWEEIGVRLDPASLTLAQDSVHFLDYRYDRTELFVIDCAAAPEIRIDRREIVAAEFVSPDDALRRDIVPALRDYLWATLASGDDR